MTAAAKIGLFMLMGLVILGVFIIKIQDIPVGERGERTTVQARFPSVAGLDRDAAVRVAGVRVGKVDGIKLDPEGHAVVTLSLEPDVRLHRGAQARIASLGMLGDKYVEISPGDPNAPPLPPDEILSGQTPPSFDDVMSTANDIGKDVKQITGSLSDTVGGKQGEEKLQEIVENIRQLTASMRDLIAANQANVNATTANFREFSATLKEQLPRIADKMYELADQLQSIAAENRGDIHASVANVRDLSARLKVSADNLNTITSKIASGEGSIGKLVNDDTTVDNLNDTLTSIEGGVKSLQNTVGRFERFHLQMLASSEALPDISETRSAFGFDLWTNDVRFWRIQYVDTPFGRHDVNTEHVTTTYDDGTTESYTRTVDSTHGTSAINAQIGYKLFPSTTLRAGLFESEGGVAVDYTVHGDRHPVVLSVEAYNWNRDEASSPHLRFEGRYFLTDNIFLSAGWDDPSYSQHSSYLVGGGITWSDEDVKYLLGLASRGF